MKEETKTGMNELPVEEGEKKGKAEKKAGKRIGFNYIIVKSLKEHRKNDVVKCYYIKSFTKWGICVVKEGTFGDSTDQHGRDIRDRLIWQKELHEQLKGKLRLPEYLGHFEENGNYYLVIGYVKGMSLGTAIRKGGQKLRNALVTGDKLAITFIDYLIQLVDLLGKLHAEGIVHRDASVGNFMVTSRNKIAVIDMELSYSVTRNYPSPAFDLGTVGFMSPQQEERNTPTFYEDIFAIGAIVLQTWTGISPSKMTRPPLPELADRVRFFIPDVELADIVIRCLQHDTEKRPAISEIKDVLTRYKNDLKKKVKRGVNKRVQSSAQEVLDVVQDGIKTMCSSLMADKEKGWFAQRQETMDEDKSKIDKGYYGSFQFGVAGPIYFMSKAAKMGMDIESATKYIEYGFDLIEKKYIQSGVSSAPGLYIGSGGVALALQAALANGLSRERKHKTWINTLLQRTANDPAMLAGRAGQGIAILGCSSLVDEWDYISRLVEDMNFIAGLLSPEGVWTIAAKKKNKVFPGFLFGNAGTIFFLLELAKRTGNKEALNFAEIGLGWYIRNKVSKNGYYDWKSPSGRDISFSLAEGTSGISLVFLKAFELTGKGFYKDHAIISLKGIDPNVVHNSLSQSAGVAGLGEVYLEAFRLFKDEYWLERSQWITDLLLNTRLNHHKYGRYWLTDTEKHPIAGFMNGNSGVLHFLMRRLFPEQLSIPLLDTNEFNSSARIVPINNNETSGLQTLSI